MIDLLLRPFRRNFGKDKKYFRQIDDLFGFIPHNIELYKLALIHKSASLVLSDGRTINNERLEYLGDAVIEAVTSDFLYIEFPDRDEGFLTQLRSKMVSRQSLNDLSHRIGLDALVIAHSSAVLSQKHLYGDAFEAMMGAIYLDQGYNFVNRLLINNIYYNFFNLDDLVESETDFKSRLIEWSQKNHHRLRFATTTAPNDTPANRVFVSTVVIDGVESAHGTGRSKKEAEQNAAYGMSHSLDDETCLRLLDKVDRLDQQERDETRPRTDLRTDLRADRQQAANDRVGR